MKEIINKGDCIQKRLHTKKTVYEKDWKIYVRNSKYRKGTI